MARPIRVLDGVMRFFKAFRDLVKVFVDSDARCLTLLAFQNLVKTKSRDSAKDDPTALKGKGAKAS